MRRTAVLLLWLALSFVVHLGVSGCHKKTDELDVWNMKPTPDRNAIYGVYIPEDLDKCIEELSKMLPSEVTQDIRKRPRNEMAAYHFGLGAWIRRNWGLRKDSRLAQYFRENGVLSPDDMSGIILDSFWCEQHGVPRSPLPGSSEGARGQDLTSD